MTGIDDFEQRLRAGLTDLAPAPGGDLGMRVMAAVDATEQAARGRWGRGDSRRLARRPAPAGWQLSAMVVVAALLVGLMGGAIAVGLGLVKLPSPLPAPSPEAEASGEAPPSFSAQPTPAEPLGLVAYNVTELVDPAPDTCTPGVFHPWCQDERIWVANADGSDAHELLPDVPAGKLVISEARIVSHDQVLALERAGVDAILVHGLPGDADFRAALEEIVRGPEAGL
jgi:hypothetical protein